MSFVPRRVGFSQMNQRFFSRVFFLGEIPLEIGPIGAFLVVLE